MFVVIIIRSNKLIVKKYKKSVKYSCEYKKITILVQ